MVCFAFDFPYACPLPWWPSVPFLACPGGVPPLAGDFPLPFALPFPAPGAFGFPASAEPASSTIAAHAAAARPSFFRRVAIIPLQIWVNTRCSSHRCHLRL